MEPWRYCLPISTDGRDESAEGSSKLGVRTLHEDAFPNEESSPRKPGNDKKAEDKAKRDKRSFNVLLPSFVA